MSSTPVSIFKGRIAQVTKANAARGLTEGLWAVVCSEGLYDKDAATVSKAKLLDAVFYTTKAEAYEESAFLLGKRPNEVAAETAHRRGRATGGAVIEGLSLAVCGNMGIGRVAGEYNSAGSRLDSGGNQARVAQSPAELAVAAVEAQQACLVGKLSDAYPHVFQGAVTMRKAKIVAEEQSHVTVQLINTDGSAGGQAKVTKELALNVFGQPIDPLGHALECASWPVIYKLVSAIFLASIGASATGTFPMRGALILLPLVMPE